MRNLTLWRSSHVSLAASDLSTSADPSSITAVAVDLDQDALLAATEQKDALNDGEVNIAIWRVLEGPENVSSALTISQHQPQCFLGCSVPGHQLPYTDPACRQSMV